MPTPSNVLYGPNSLAYDTYAVKTPAPGLLTGGEIAYRHIRPLGTQLVTSDMRKFRFAAAGTSTLVIGNVLTAGVLTASQQDLSPAAGAVGARSVSLTTGASSARNLFAEGWLQTSVTPGIGETYLIGSHDTMTSGAGDIVYLAQGHALRQAITTSTRFNLVDNPYFRAIQLPATTVASQIIGIAVTAPTTLLGCWVGTRGVFGVLVAGTIIAGNRVNAPMGTAGAIGPETATAATSKIEITIGDAMYASASGAASPIFVRLDG